MSLVAAVSAFSHRGARARAAVSWLIYSGLLAFALLLLAAWLVPDARRSDLELADMWNRYRPETAAQIHPELWTTLALADVFAVFVLGAIAFLIAPAVVAATVANERRNGTLDQLRTTPQSPLALACGLIIGAPARLWLLATGPLLIHVVAGVFGALPILTLVQSLLVIAVGGAAACTIGLAVALAPRQESGGAFAALGVAAAMMAMSSMVMTLINDRQLVSWAFVHPAGALDAVMLDHDGLWRRLMNGTVSARFSDSDVYGSRLSVVPALSLLSSLILGVALLRASCRKLGDPDLPLLSKPLAMLLFTLIAATVSGPLFGLVDRDLNGWMVLALSMLMLPVLLICGLFATPSFEVWAMGLRRRRPGWREDAASPQRMMWLVELAWAALMLCLSHAYDAGHLSSDRRWALALIIIGAVSLPSYLLFANTRFSSLATRWAFAVAIVSHLFVQLIAIGDLWEQHTLRDVEQTFLALATMLAIGVPVWIGWRQHLLTNKTRLARA